MDRRTFVTALGAAALTGPRARLDAAPRPQPRLIGIQLYTVRRLMSSEPERTLATLADIGYREVELAGLYGSSAREFRAMLDRAGLAAPASHLSIPQLRDQREQTFDDAQLLGHRWLVVPWIDQRDRNREGLTRLCEFFNETARAAQQRGLRFAYHNHDFEFTPIDGMIPFELLLERTDPQLVQFELDLFWLRKGGHGALEYFARFPGRFPMLHVKDMAADGTMVNVGEGVIDFAAVFAAAAQGGVQHYFVEHDNPTTPIEDVRVSHRNISRLLQ